MGIFIRRRLAMGWLPDYPDFRDLTVENDDVSLRLKVLGQTDSVKKMLTKTGVAKAAKPSLPASVSLIPWFSPVEDQGELGSCTANAGVGLVEYFAAGFWQAYRCFKAFPLQNHSQYDAGKGRYGRFFANHNGSHGIIRASSRRILALL